MLVLAMLAVGLLAVGMMLLSLGSLIGTTPNMNIDHIGTVVTTTTHMVVNMSIWFCVPVLDDVPIEPLAEFHLRFRRRLRHILWCDCFRRL
jgi:hypothetical protein